MFDKWAEGQSGNAKFGERVFHPGRRVGKDFGCFLFAERFVGYRRRGFRSKKLDAVDQPHLVLKQN